MFYKWPSICASVLSGIRFTNKAPLPLTNRIESFWNRCDLASFSSCPVCLARAAASFWISPTAILCQPPKDSMARGMNLIPCLLQSSSNPQFFRCTATSRAWPGLAAAPAKVAAWRGWMTVTSQAVSSPPVQCGTSTSAGRLSSPGRRNLPSLDGPREAATAVLYRASRSDL